MMLRDQDGCVTGTNIGLDVRVILLALRRRLRGLGMTRQAVAPDYLFN